MTTTDNDTLTDNRLAEIVESSRIRLEMKGAAFGNRIPTMKEVDLAIVALADRKSPVNCRVPSENEIHLAISGVQLFTRVNDLIKPPKIEVCRYGSDEEEEIVVLSQHDTSLDEAAVRRTAVRNAQARAVLALITSGYGTGEDR